VIITNRRHLSISTSEVKLFWQQWIVQFPRSVKMFERSSIRDLDRTTHRKVCLVQRHVTCADGFRDS